MQELTKRIAELSQQSRLLEWTGENLAQALRQVSEFAGDFIDTLPNQRVFAYATPHWNEDLPPEPAGIAAALAELHSELLPGGINAVSGDFFGYVPGGGIPSAAIGDFLAAITNRYAGVYDAGPGAAALEALTVDWQRRIIGYPDGAAGTLQSGGSLATFTCVLAARETRPFDAWAGSVVYMTKEAHHCIDKALLMAGLRCATVRYVGVDASLRLDVANLKAAVAADRAAGLRPWMVFASAGTINTGAVDPLADIADVAHAEGLWLHVDAAYGGFFVLTDQAARFAGIERADSVVLDPHKGLFLPYGCGTALVRDGALLRNAFQYDSDYLADVAHTRNSPADLSPELTRHFRALRLWMTVKCHGMDRLKCALQEKLLLARYAYQRLQALPQLTMGPEPMLSCVTFRVHGADDATRDLLAHILAEGRSHFSSTRIHGALYLRMCILCFRSHIEHVDRAIGAVSRFVAQRRN